MNSNRSSHFGHRGSEEFPGFPTFGGGGSSSTSSSAFSTHLRAESPPLPIFASSRGPTTHSSTPSSSSSQDSGLGPASGRGRYDPTPKYINDFSKAMASEVRILLQEVGKLRDEKRALQYEIGGLMGTLSQYSPGGQYAPPEWRHPNNSVPSTPSNEYDPMPVPARATEVTGPVRPGWRTVNPRQKQLKSSTKALPPSNHPPPPLPPVEPPKAAPSWTTWRPNSAMATPPRHTPLPPPAAPHLPGLFGARTPPPR